MTNPFDTPELQAERKAKIKLLLAERGVPVVGDFREKAVEYLSREPKKIEIQIPLVEYFERTRQVKADKWQHHFCNYLESSVADRIERQNWAEFHAQAQLGKTTVMSQCFPAWCIGHDPLWQTVLAMYNQTRSEGHSQVVLQMLRSKVHRDIFRNEDGYPLDIVSKSGWMTRARRDLNDGQNSFTPAGLQSGITGSSADLFLIDDPYKDPKEAFSETVFANLERFWQMGIEPRLRPWSLVFAMFHRYSYDDFGGYLLNTGKFDYVRYASIADGSYIHEDTGQKFEDPLGRAYGELICPERFGPRYYDSKRANEKVWLSMFQGRPGREEGDFFKVGMIGEYGDDEWMLCNLKGRGWDHAATADAGDQSAGVLMGVTPTGDFLVDDVFSGQLDTGSRITKQVEIAEADGRDVTVVIPEDKAAAGKDVVFFTRQYFEGYNVVARPVANSAPGSDAKKRRAHNLSAMVNTGKVKFRRGAPWADRLRRLMRRFGNSISGDDEIDAMSDVFNYLNEQYYKGLVIKNFDQARIVAPWSAFAQKFNNIEKIPAVWTTYVGVKITADASRPNSAVIVTRASKSSGLSDTLFVVAEYKEFTSDFIALFDWIDAALGAYCEGGKDAHIWLHPDSEEYKQTIWQKLKRPVSVFDGDKVAGLTEIGWYLRPIEGQENPFNPVEDAAGMYWLVSDEQQLSAATDEYGLYALRQEAATWGFDTKGEPNATGAVLDCLRMICYSFRTVSAGLSRVERIEEALPVALRAETIEAMPDDQIKDAALTKRMIEASKIQKQIDKPVRGPHVGRFARR